MQKSTQDCLVLLPREVHKTGVSLLLCIELTLAGCQAPTKASLSLPSTTGVGRENTMKDKGQERSLTKF